MWGITESLSAVIPTRFSVSLCISKPARNKITINAKSENQFVTISIQDKGPGISIEEQERIFQKYVTSKSQSIKGTGLGLAIAKEFVEVQGGIIGIESTPGKGSTFYFTLPKA